ncbi:MAG: hypothetical protein JWN68_3420 [Nocardioides sp.]|jgi:hypothetical protein|uniref:hypothetical protein n=1 Tax=Nocardioides sp. TaxID=35761 RepID=UPI00261351F3|nr:hypothetical protein [Nocardioides sp.]MCW2835467.1 hypothetical protein [Nocardioides sp.]
MTATISAPPLEDVAPRLRPVEVFTDEELSLLTYGPGAVVTPYFSTLASKGIEIAQRSAYRGLVARGIVDPEADPGPGPVRLKLREDILTLVTLRQAATCLVAVARTLVDAQDFWYAHVVDELVVLEEVTVDGLHRFALGFTRDLPALLVGAALHADATDGTGETVSIDAMSEQEAPAQLLEVLGQAHLRADVVVISAAEDNEAGTRARTVSRPELIGVFSGPDGCWSVTSAPGSGAVAIPERVEGLRLRIRSLADQATGTDS